MSTKLGVEFFKRSTFAVVGASKDPTKFGNRVLKCYIAHQKPVIAIHPKEEIIEGLHCAKSLSKLPEDIRSDLGVSIVTPPAITRQVLEEGFNLGIKHYLTQPGTLDQACHDYIQETMKPGDCHVVESCVLRELGCDHS